MARSMDVTNCRPTQGADPAAAVPAAVDWHSQLQPEARCRIVNKILTQQTRFDRPIRVHVPRMETLKKHVPVSVPAGLNELQKIAERFEETIYAVATSQSDYLRKISLKMLSMETTTRNSSGHSRSNSPGPGCDAAGSTLPPRIGVKRQRDPPVTCLSPDREGGASFQTSNIAHTRVAPKEPTFTCTVCLDKLEQSSVTTCGHIFCEKCIKASIKAQKKCPTCRKRLGARSYRRVYLPKILEEDY